MNIVSSEKELIRKFIDLETQLAEAKTKYNRKSKVVQNIQKRLESINPEIQKNQLNTIELSIKSNQSKINLNQKQLEELNEDFKLQPTLLREFEQLQTELKIAEDNFDSLMSAKENFRLELAQKSLPWRIVEKPDVLPFPISPNVKDETFRNFLISIFIGLSFAYFRELTDKVLHDDNGIEKIMQPYGISLLGSIPYMSNLEEDNIEDSKETKKVKSNL